MKVIRLTSLMLAGVLSFAATMILIGCNPSQSPSSRVNRAIPFAAARYEIALTAVDRPVLAREHFGEAMSKRILSPGSPRDYFEDRMFGITWWVKPADISFVLQSKTDNPIEIVWAEARFVDVKGSVHKSLRMESYSENSRDEKSKSPVSTVVAGKEVLVGSIHPADSVHGRQKDPILPDKLKGTVDELQLKIQPLVGKSLQVVLPFRVRGRQFDYTFTFRINRADAAAEEFYPEVSEGDQPRRMRKGRSDSMPALPESQH